VVGRACGEQSLNLRRDPARFLAAAEGSRGGRGNTEGRARGQGRTHLLPGKVLRRRKSHCNRVGVGVGGDGRGDLKREKYSMNTGTCKDAYGVCSELAMRKH
jgi:hypothetical protein